MKSLEIQTNKRLLIVEDAEHGSFFPPKWSNYKLEKDGEVWRPICSGSDLTEEIAQGMVQESKYMNYAGESGWVDYKVYPDGLIFGAIDSFISAIEAQGWYWGENAKQKDLDRCNEYTDGFTIAARVRAWEETESRTLHPERCIIFEIVEGQS